MKTKDLAKWIDLQLSTEIDGISAGYSLGNYNSVWIDKGAFLHLQRTSRPTHSGNQKSNNVQYLTRPTAQSKDDENKDTLPTAPTDDAHIRQIRTI